MPIVLEKERIHTIGTKSFGRVHLKKHCLYFIIIKIFKKNVVHLGGDYPFYMLNNLLERIRRD